MVATSWLPTIEITGRLGIVNSRNWRLDDISNIRFSHHNMAMEGKPSAVPERAVAVSLPPGSQQSTQQEVDICGQATHEAHDVVVSLPMGLAKFPIARAHSPFQLVHSRLTKKRSPHPGEASLASS